VRGGASTRVAAAAAATTTSGGGGGTGGSGGDHSGPDGHARRRLGARDAAQGAAPHRLAGTAGAVARVSIAIEGGGVRQRALELTRTRARAPLCCSGARFGPPLAHAREMRSRSMHLASWLLQVAVCVERGAREGAKNHACQTTLSLLVPPLRLLPRSSCLSTKSR
jgi:hypothetical protein